MMRITRLVTIVALTALLAALPAGAAAQALPKAASPEAVGMSAERLGRITRVMQEAARDRQIAGTVTLVLRDGQVVYFEAAGRRRPREERADAHRHHLPDRVDDQGRGQRRRDDAGRGRPDRAHRSGLEVHPGLREPRPCSPPTAAASPWCRPRRPITIRDLLTHTAGISYGSGVLEPFYTPAGFTLWYFADRAQNMTAWIDKLATLPFESQPGDRWVYGYNTDILGNVLERVSGQTLAAFLGERIITPLKMVDTSFFLPADKAGRLAAVYAVGADGTITRAPDGHPGQGHYTGGPQVAFSGGAGLLSTAADYARFLQMMANGGELDGTRYLSPTTVALMTSNHVGTLYQNGALGWGLGFEVVEQPGRAPRYGAAGEFSWSGAYHTTLLGRPGRKAGDGVHDPAAAGGRCRPQPPRTHAGEPGDRRATGAGETCAGHHDVATGTSARWRPMMRRPPRGIGWAAAVRAAVLCGVATLAGCGTAASPPPSDPPASLPPVLAAARQLLVVTTSGWDDVSGELRRYERAAAGDVWQPGGHPGRDRRRPQRHGVGSGDDADDARADQARGRRALAGWRLRARHGVWTGRPRRGRVAEAAVRPGDADPGMRRRPGLDALQPPGAP